MKRLRTLGMAIGAGLIAGQAATAAATDFRDPAHPVQHVLLISVDGLHAVDAARYVSEHPGSTMAGLVGRGVNYTAAVSGLPSDSFPGLVALVTGGTPVSTGVYYDDMYDRALSAPGSKCETKGTEVVYDEAADKDPDARDAGGGMDEAKLPRDPAAGCSPVYPHAFLRTNTIFEVVKAAGGRTAWADKHPAYDLVNGPSGKGVDDLFVPEIAAEKTTDTVAATEAYDDTKVEALLNQIAGKDHAGVADAPVPVLMGMNFQAISVAQKLKGNGYRDAAATPSDGLAEALSHTDASLGKLVAALKQHQMDANTLIVVTAKHGQSPIDPAKRRIVDSKALGKALDGVKPDLAAQVTGDDVALIWLTDQSLTGKAAAALLAQKQALGIDTLWSGKEVAQHFGDPATDSRAPDIIIQPEAGVIYAKPTATKIAEHGGFTADDSNVALIVAGPGIAPAKIATPVHTTAVAPTILGALGLKPDDLKSVAMEHTPRLPGLPY